MCEATLDVDLSTGWWSEREELLQLLLQHGILYRSADQPILSRDGSPASWMLNSLAVTLTPHGSQLAARCILKLLEGFEGRQLATYGLTGVPILQSCIAALPGSYHGLLIRKEAKTSGSLKIIEGPLNRDEPVVIIDNSISSGISMEEACRRLSEAGLRVEGGVFLVRFGWYGGFGRMRENGLHVAAVFDIWEDFMMRMPGEMVPARNPSKSFPAIHWSSVRAPEDLHPAELARVAIRHYLQTGSVLRPPGGLQGEHDAAGGVWVSLRSRRNIHLRHTRDGYWRFPGEHHWSVPEGIIRAGIRAAVHLPAGAGGEPILNDSSIAVTFFGALEACKIGDLDNDRYGVVVRSQERPPTMGGALPRMPGIANEWAQFAHARRNARLVSFELYHLYRHTVTKAVEPGVRWQPTGVPISSALPWHQRHDLCGPIAERARDIVIAALSGTSERLTPLANDSLPMQVEAIYLTIFLDGRIRGCMGVTVTDLDRDLHTLALSAIRDTRFASPSERNERAVVAVTVSLLHSGLLLGQMKPEEVIRRIRHGEQALMAVQLERSGLLLPVVATHYSLGPLSYALEVKAKARIEGDAFAWWRFDCSTWLQDDNGTSQLRGAFKITANATQFDPQVIVERSHLLAMYLVRQQKADGTLYVRYEPFQDRLFDGVSAPRTAHGAWILTRASSALRGRVLSEAVEKALWYHLARVISGDDGSWLSIEDDTASVAELSFLLLALCELPTDDPDGLGQRTG